MQKNSLFSFHYSLGTILIFLIKLNFFWFLFSLRGGIILGVFPATSSVINLLIHSFETREIPTELYNSFKLNYVTTFKEINLLGYSYLFALVIFYIDVRIAGQILNNPFIHGFLLSLLFLFFLTGLHLFPCFTRYDLSFFNYFKQSFFIMISNIIETIAIIIGLLLTIVITTFLPILVVVSIISFSLLPISWFSLQAMKKIEIANNVTSDH
jgi:uncharacterized membrane protein YesL